MFGQRSSARRSWRPWLPQIQKVNNFRHGRCPGRRALPNSSAYCGRRAWRRLREIAIARHALFAFTRTGSNLPVRKRDFFSRKLRRYRKRYRSKSRCSNWKKRRLPKLNKRRGTQEPPYESPNHLGNSWEQRARLLFNTTKWSGILGARDTPVDRTHTGWALMEGINRSNSRHRIARFRRGVATTTRERNGANQRPAIWAVPGFFLSANFCPASTGSFLRTSFSPAARPKPSFGQVWRCCDLAGWP